MKVENVTNFQIIHFTSLFFQGKLYYYSISEQV